MKKVLVVEDSKMVMKILRHVMSQSEQFEPVYTMSFAETKEALKTHNNEFFAALVDLSLPDAPDGEVVDYVMELEIPTVVLTGSFDMEKRQQLLSKGVVDYVTKEGKYSYEFALGVLNRLVKNQNVKVLVVDDSNVSRVLISNMLRLHMFQVFEAEDGAKAIKVLLQQPDIRMLITDFNMPRMDGCELIKNIRIKYEKSDLVIIGLSADDESALSAKFIKSGANDFLRKPFNHEEFFCRISHNIEFLDLIEQIRDAASRDDLTGAYNRKYFFQQGEQMHMSAEQNGTPLSVALIDLDDFKEVNDVYGHDIGDLIIKFVAKRLMELFDRFLIARSGGQEFFVLMAGLDNEKATAYVDKVRQVIGSESFEIGSDAVSISYSGGVSNLLGESFDGMLTSAAVCLRRAKDAGGDLVFGDD